MPAYTRLTRQQRYTIEAMSRNRSPQKEIAVAMETGIFTRYGLNVALTRELGWASVRDKMFYGNLDASPGDRRHRLRTRAGPRRVAV